jgi:hypothetical protein
MRPFERVHTMTDYWDGPRAGIADFDGRPHAYASRFDEARDDYEEVFELRPVDDETLALALEDWQMFQRWEEAYRAGKVTLDAHQVLLEDRARHQEIAGALRERLAALPGPVTLARAVFRPAEGHAGGGRGRALEVQWTPVA